MNVELPVAVVATSRGVPPRASGLGLAARVTVLTQRYGSIDGEALLRPLIEHEFRDRIAVVSSFGAEAAVVLGLVAAIDRRTPVIFIDTGKLFGETLRYRDQLIAKFRLEDVRAFHPDPLELAAADAAGVLWRSDPDRCCALRKIAPLAAALRDFDAWISGRKRYHGGGRTRLPLFEPDDAGRIKINPVAGWSRHRVAAEFAAHDLPRHPLEADGYLSIGCMTCTDRVRPDEDLRAGRWRGRAKTECGIHLRLVPPP
jgi:phosphoadenosine phosphosulfate reductase